MKLLRACPVCGTRTSSNTCPVCRTTASGKPAKPKPVDHDQLTFDFTTTTGGTN